MVSDFSSSQKRSDLRNIELAIPCIISCDLACVSSVPACKTGCLCTWRRWAARASVRASTLCIIIRCVVLCCVCLPPLQNWMPVCIALLGSQG
jgi:hypothetical protein